MATKSRLIRSHDRMVVGGCASVAEYLNLDPTHVRIGFVLLSVLSRAFPGLLVYIILRVTMPEQ